MKSHLRMIFLFGVILSICPCQLAQKLPPRRLTEQQKTALKRELAQVSEKSKVRIVCIQDGEPCQYAHDFADVLGAAGWTIDGGDTGPITYARFTGTQSVGSFLLVSAREEKVPPAVAALRHVLKVNQVGLTFQSSDDLPKGTCEIRILYKAGEQPNYPN